MGDRERAEVSAWCAFDHEHALVPADHEIIDSTPVPRALVLELAARGVDGARDLFSACAVLGRLIAERGGSPTLAAATMDGARAAIGGAAETWISPARAALFEGYAAAQRDLGRRDAAAAWEYPRCAVPLDALTLAVVAGHPADDGEALAGWAARVAQAAALAGVRRAVVAEASPDRAAARVALVEAMSLAGIEVTTALPGRTSWLPWKRGTLL